MDRSPGVSASRVRICCCLRRGVRSPRRGARFASSHSLTISIALLINKCAPIAAGSGLIGSAPDQILQGNQGCAVIKSEYASLLSRQDVKSRPRSRGRLYNNPAPTYSPNNPAVAVPSALVGLTAVFGMGTGVTPPPSAPETL
jgi:hypothetical protein